MKTLKAISIDLLLIIGICGVSYGLYEIYYPLPFIFVGLLIIYIATLLQPNRLDLPAKNTKKGK